MPTILDTLGIAQCTISYGKEGSFAGRLATVSIRVTPKALGIDYLRLTWAATGDMFSGFYDTSTGTSGTPGIIVLPQTGQTGFRHGTTTFKDWYYEAVVTAQLDDGQQLSRTYRFQIPSGTTALDLDMLDEDGVVTILPAIAPILAEPAGLSPDTRTALAATYPAMRATAPSAAERAAGVVAYIDTVTMPPVLKGWSGTAWVALGGSAAAAVTTIDNGDGTFTATGSGVTDNGDGTYSITDPTVTANADGTFTLAA